MGFCDEGTAVRPRVSHSKKLTEAAIGREGSGAADRTGGTALRGTYGGRGGKGREVAMSR